MWRAMCRAAKVFFACITLVHGYNNGMGRTPPMGWNSWCTGGGTFDPSLCNLLGRDPCSEEEVKSTADAIVNQGMDKLGYKYIALGATPQRSFSHRYSSSPMENRL